MLLRRPTGKRRNSALRSVLPFTGFISCAVALVVLTHPHYGACPLDRHLWAQTVVEQQLGCPMLKYLSETTEEERLHVRRGNIDLLASHMKMRFVAPGDWIRIMFDLKPLVRHACGEAYLCSRLQAGELLQMVYFRPMGALCDTSLLSVFHQLQLHLGRRCALDVPSQHLTIQLPGRVPIGERYSLLDLYFACATMDKNREVFVDDHRILQLVVITTPPSPSITWEGEKCLAFG